MLTSADKLFLKEKGALMPANNDDLKFSDIEGIPAITLADAYNLGPCPKCGEKNYILKRDCNITLKDIRKSFGEVLAAIVCANCGKKIMKVPTGEYRM